MAWTRWTPARIERLRELAPKMTGKELAEEFGCGYQGMLTRLSILGISPRTNAVQAYAEQYGVSFWKVKAITAARLDRMTEAERVLILKHNRRGRKPGSIAQKPSRIDRMFELLKRCA